MICGSKQTYTRTYTMQNFQAACIIECSSLGELIAIGQNYSTALMQESMRSVKSSMSDVPGMMQCMQVRSQTFVMQHFTQQFQQRKHLHFTITEFCTSCYRTIANQKKPPVFSSPAIQFKKSIKVVAFDPFFHPASSHRDRKTI